jgi:uncharacterized protein (DUF2345 family)
MAMNEDVSPIDQPDSKPGPYLATVVSHLDPTYMGGLEVEILRPSGSTQSEGQLHQVKYMSPFYGVTPISTNESANDFTNTQQSYGMWMVPPDVGSTVIIIFIDGDPKRGYWIGCVQDENMNFMVPGYAATKQIVDGDGNRYPAGEYNKNVNNSPGDPEQIKKPKHPFAEVLTAQGLIGDDIRGITSSSARREAPSAVFGVSTPGPLDKSTGARQGSVGKAEHRIPNAYMSRLGGSSFVMDDGDAAFLRKGPASSSPPEYAAVEQGESGGDPSIPHNELVRIRTRTGHQILLHNSEDLIYIANAKGTAWIELTSNGKIDIYAADSISMHTGKDFNVTADGDINLTSTGGNINLNANSAFKATAAGSYEIKAGADGKLTAGGSTNILSGGNHVETAAAIHMNGPGASSASSAPVAPRVPDVEPWADHENLHGSALKYTTTTDTFMKDKGATK